MSLLSCGENNANTDERDLLALLEISSGSAVAVVGCGGKTSLIELIAMLCIDRKVLVSTTTKTFPMISDVATLCDTMESCIEHVPQTGIQCLGKFNERNGKLEALPENILVDLVPHYDIVLMEADGSRWLPCKGWLDSEPVVYYYSTHTVGVVTMNALGRAATSEVVHHLPEFLTLTGLREGDIITEQVLEDMVCLPKGMFKGSVGKEYLLVNKVENENEIRIAEAFLQKIKAKYPGRFNRLIYGSVHRNTWYEV